MITEGSQGRNSDQEAGGRTLEEHCSRACSWAHLQALSSLSYTAQSRLPRDGAATGGLGPPIAAVNHTVSKAWPFLYGQSLSPGSLRRLSTVLSGQLRLITQTVIIGLDVGLSLGICFDKSNGLCCSITIVNCQLYRT